MRTSYSTKPRRGILLLVILSLLVLFVLVGMTFIIVASQYRRTAATAARIGRSGDTPRQLADTAIHQILRGTLDANSALYGHSLLNDMYGQDGFRGSTLAGSATASSNEFLLIKFRSDNPSEIQPNLIVGANNSTLDSSRNNVQAEGFYNGGVLTFTNGQMAGRTTRIIDYSWINREIRVEGFPDGYEPPADIRFVANGPPFNGTGVGYDKFAGTMNALASIGMSDYGVALLPNHSAYIASIDTGSPFANLPYLGWEGGLDESYDSPDFQNMFLGWQPAEISQRSSYVIPSYHRPSLALYWLNLLLDEAGKPPITDPTDLNNRPDFAQELNELFGQPDDLLSALDADQLRRRNLMRAAILRPLGFDHDTFSGSNLNNDLLTQYFGFNPITGPWDIDNDGDGVADSVWVDLGMPVQRSAAGRLYKPLFALQVLDMDGRLNVNAQGSLAHADATYGLTTSPFGNGRALAGNPEVAFAALVARGEGFGPADIYLGDAMFGRKNRMINAFNDRYGNNSDNVPGEPSVADQLGSLSPSRDIFVRPPDFHGAGAVAIGHAGQPVYAKYNESPFAEFIDTPYELNLLDPNGKDLTFSVQDLETLLRFPDADRTDLSNRLSKRTNWSGLTSNNDTRRRAMTTTHSFNVPVTGAPLDALYLFESQITDFDARDQIYMIPTEMLRRQKMDLNRPFGDGFDSTTTATSNPLVITGRNVADEAEEMRWLRDNDNATYVNWLNDMLPYDGSYPQATHPLRQAYARQLYCLMMMLTNRDLDGDGPDSTDFDGNGVDDTPLERARAIAQWCINVVDFRDADSEMTPFVYDDNPFDGWDATLDGSAASMTANPDKVVWGCERPELLITETSATHDRRTEDRDDEVSDDMAAFFAEDGSGDTDFDQRLRPMGALFIELYNPWLGTYTRYATPTSAERPSGDIYGPGNATNAGELEGVMLNAVSSDANGTGTPSPVWRMLVVKGSSQLANADEPWVQYDLDDRPVASGANFKPQHVERVIYFANPNLADPRNITDYVTLTTGVDQREVMVPSPTMANQTAVIQPGRYAVVGPGSDLQAFGEGNAAGPQFTKFITPFGRAINPDDSTPYGDGEGITAAQHISLEPNRNPNFTGQVLINGQNPFALIPTAVVIDQALTDTGTESRRLNVSEPPHGYDSPGWDATLANGEGAYGTVADVPFDAMREGLITDRDVEVPEQLMADGIVYTHRTIVLQRLANPMAPWEQYANPYRTVDKAHVDLSVFNGVEDDSASLTSTGTTVNFSSHERGWRERKYFDPVSPTPLRLLWKQERPRVQNIDPPHPVENPIKHVYPYELQHSLGSLNTTYGPQITSGVYAGQPNTSSAAAAHAFPWLTWNNRPFAHALELLLVPRSSSARVLHDFNIGTNQNLFTSTPGPSGNPADSPPFSHLMNFFNSNVNLGIANIAMLFDMVDVPSPFLGTKRYYSDTTLWSLKGSRNSLSRFRDPGLVNINTINNYRTWNALFGIETLDGANDQTYWPIVARSMRVPGYNPATPATRFNVNLPTQFPRPFRSATSAYLVPGVTGLEAPRPVDGGLLRGAAPANYPEFSLPNEIPLMDSLWIQYAKGQLPNSYSDATRNPFFRYQLLGRLRNSTTTRSSVFAAWVTVGKFEVEPYTDDSDVDMDGTEDRAVILPDGYQLGQEIGSDTGEITRHRSFFIIDRSIPVAFEPGQNHNVDEAIILQRFIE